MGFGVRPPLGLGIKIHECGGGQGGVSVYIYSYLGIYLKKFHKYVKTLVGFIHIQDKDIWQQRPPP